MESVQSTAIYPVAGKEVAEELETLCFPETEKCRALEAFFAEYEKAVDESRILY